MSFVGLTTCYFCGKGKDVLIDKRLRESRFPDHGKVGVVDMSPCQECEAFMKQGIILMSIRNETTQEEMQGPIPNPHRTGGWVVVKEEAVKSAIEDGPMLDFMIKHRFGFIADEAWDLFGLPRNVEIDNRK